MKYIRTKDGIIADKNLPDCGKRMRDYIIEGDIADTIEELCDEFVIIKNGKPELFVRHNDEVVKSCAFESFVKYDLPHSNKIEDVFGAVWTDKGLQFVARMNDEGVLELL